MTPEVSENGKRFPARLALLFLLSGLMAMGPLSTDYYLPSLPAMGVDFGEPAERLTLTLSVFLIGFGFGQIVWGPISDRFGRRPTIAAGLLLYTGASIGCALASDLDTLLTMRVLQSLATAAGPICARATVRDMFDANQAAGVLGMLAGIMGVVPLAAPALGGIIAETIGWRVNFWVMGGFTGLLFMAFYFLMPESLPRHMQRPIRPASLLLSYVTLIRDREIRAYLYTVAALFAGLFSFLAGSAFVMQDLYGLTPTQYGSLFGIMVSGFLVGSFITQFLTKRYGAATVLKGGMYVVATGGLAYAAIAIDGIGSPAALVAAQLILATGIGLTSPHIAAQTMRNYPHMAGTAAALLGATQLAVGSVSGWLTGIAYDGTARPMTTIVACGVLISFVIFRFFVPRPADEGNP